MEMEAVKQESAALESQLVSLKKQIDCLALEVDEHKTRVNYEFFFAIACWPQFLPQQKNKKERPFHFSCRLLP